MYTICLPVGYGWLFHRGAYKGFKLGNNCELVMTLRDGGNPGSSFIFGKNGGGRLEETLLLRPLWREESSSSLLWEEAKSKLLPSPDPSESESDVCWVRRKLDGKSDVEWS